MLDQILWTVTVSRRPLRAAAVLAALVFALGVPAAEATENGQTHVDLGYLGILGGITPPLGEVYLRADTNVVWSGTLNDRNGNPVKVNLGPYGQAPVKYQGNSVAEVLSFAYVPDYVIPILNARIGISAYTYYAGARAEGQERIFGEVSGSGESRSGLGDTTVIPFFLHWDLPNSDLHVNVSPAEFTASTGDYDKSDPLGASIGLNYFSYRPAVVVTYLNRRGLELDLNTNVSINQTNGATHYRSGDEFSITYAALQHFSPALAAGVEGYYYKQFTGDQLNGVEVNTVRPTSAFAVFDPLNQGPGNKGQVFAIGPAVTYNFTPTIATDIRFQHEFFSDNRRQGEVLWAKLSGSF
jgi:hypothetical protein